VKRSGKLLAAILCIALALVFLTPVSAQQYGYGFLSLKPGNFDPIAYFRPVASSGSTGYPGFGYDPFNPFIYGSVWNPLSFLGPRNPPDVSIPATTKNESKGDEKNSSLTSNS
jgi:hypothetical protein